VSTSVKPLGFGISCTPKSHTTPTNCCHTPHTGHETHIMVTLMDTVGTSLKCAPSQSSSRSLHWHSAGTVPSTPWQKGREKERILDTPPLSILKHCNLICHLSRNIYYVNSHAELISTKLLVCVSVNYKFLRIPIKLIWALKRNLIFKGQVYKSMLKSQLKQAIGLVMNEW